MGRKRLNETQDIEMQQQYDRGQRIKYIREKELKMSKTELAEKIGTSSQFLGLVEAGKSNLVYYSIGKLREISGYSSDYILFGIDDNLITKTNNFLENYSEYELVEAISDIKKLCLFIKNTKGEI